MSKSEMRRVTAQAGGPVLRLKEFAVTQLGIDRIYISHTSGEGGVFDADKFEEVVREFFNREF